MVFLWRNGIFNISIWEGLRTNTKNQIWKQCSRKQWHPTPYSCLENPMDRGAWWATVHGVARSQTRLSSFTFTFHFHALEKEMATHSSLLAWRIPWTEKPGRLQSMGSHRVRHDWSDLVVVVVVVVVYISFTRKQALWIQNSFVPYNST